MELIGAALEALKQAKVSFEDKLEDSQWKSNTTAIITAIQKDLSQMVDTVSHFVEVSRRVDFMERDIAQFKSQLLLRVAEEKEADSRRNAQKWQIFIALLVAFLSFLSPFLIKIWEFHTVPITQTIPQKP